MQNTVMLLVYYSSANDQVTMSLKFIILLSNLS